MLGTKEQLLYLIRSVLCDDPLPIGFEITDVEGLYSLAERHDITHIVGYAIEKNKIMLNSDDVKKFQLHRYIAIRRVLTIEQELKQIKSVFEKFNLDYIPLKGAYIRHLYPENWMRVSGDMDILVHSNELQLAEKILVEQLSYKIDSHGSHHDHVVAPCGYHVDLHFTLTERDSKAKALLDDVWNHCSLAENALHEYMLDDEYFYLFHMFHASVHFLNGGCGIRPVLDTWILNHRKTYDKEKRQQLIQEANLTKFSSVIESIAEKWFSGKDICDTDDVENYILTGGVYGGTQHIAAKQASAGTRRKYIIRRLFPPYRTIRYGYPILKKLPFLLPFCWVHRIFKTIFSDRSRQAKYELIKTRQESDKSQEIKELFDKLGL